MWTLLAVLALKCISAFSVLTKRVTTCLENLEMCGNLTADKELSGSWRTVGMVRKKSCQGKTVYCQLCAFCTALFCIIIQSVLLYFVSIHDTDNSNTVGIALRRQVNVGEFHSTWRVVAVNKWIHFSLSSVYCDNLSVVVLQMIIIYIGIGEGAGKGTCPHQKNSGKIFFRQKSCKIREFC